MVGVMLGQLQRGGACNALYPCRRGWRDGFSTFGTAPTTMCLAHPRGAVANTRCATNDSSVTDEKSARVWGD